jgi:hypothetical protein
LGLIITASACAHFQRTKAPSIQQEWMTTLASAQRAADSGKYDAAEKTLVTFANTHPRTIEAREIAFWRALYLMDPQNKAGSLAAGVSGMDAYLADDSTTWYRAEATILKRTASLAQALKLGSAAAVTATAPATSTSTGVDPATLKTRDEEIASLRDQLAKVNAELDRIKKRLANPRG